MATKTGSTDDVALTRDWKVIFSNYSEKKFKTLDKSGNLLFKYSHEKLITPFGLTVDGHGNIFVNGCDSNNIHIVSNNWKTVRILKGVQGS